MRMTGDQKFAFARFRISDLRGKQREPSLKTLAAQEIFFHFTAQRKGAAYQANVRKFGNKHRDASIYFITHGLSNTARYAFWVHRDEQAAAEF